MDNELKTEVDYEPKMQIGYAKWIPRHSLATHSIYDENDEVAVEIVTRPSDVFAVNFKNPLTVSGIRIEPTEFALDDRIQTD